VAGNAWSRTGTGGDTALLPLMLLYGAASLLHFVHNALYVGEYPNLPVWLTARIVLEAWLVEAVTGVAGYLLYSRVSRVLGLILIAAYAVLGLAGLDHYTVAPLSAHTVGMNLTILFEVATAAVLLFFVLRAAIRLAGRRA
jgi:hypothetical protein